MTFRSLFSAPPAYTSTSPWPPLLAVPVSISIVIAAMAFAAFAAPWVNGLSPDEMQDNVLIGRDFSDPAGQRILMTTLLLSQSAMIALTCLTALHGGPRAVLKLERPAGGWITLLYAVIAVASLSVVFSGLVQLIAPDQAAKDLAFFVEIAKTPSFLLTAVTVGLGASLSEELLFRGFLLSALARSRSGYWPAAILATVGWTLLHLGYSWIGLVEVFLFGLFFSWLLWRTGSLWPSLFCHAAYNFGLLVVLRYWG